MAQQFTFILEAVSRSNAKLVRGLIPVKEYVIGHSFNTKFVLTNETDIESPEFEVTISFRMDPYTYPYIFKIPKIAAGDTFTTRAIRWDVLNQGVCTFYLSGIHSQSHDKFVLQNISGNDISINDIFHKIVTTTPEAIYEYWAMLMAAVGLLILAIDKLVHLIRWLYQFLLSF